MAIGEFASHQQIHAPKNSAPPKSKLGEAAAFLTANQDSVDILVHVRSFISYGKMIDAFVKSNGQKSLVKSCI